MLNLQLQHRFTALLHVNRAAPAQYQAARRTIRDQIEKDGPARRRFDKLEILALSHTAKVKVMKKKMKVMKT